MNMKLRIRDLREDRDLPQKAVAAYLSCDQSLYSKYERGERDIPLAAVCRIADYYQTSVDYLVGRTDNPRPYPPARPAGRGALPSNPLRRIWT